MKRHIRVRASTSSKNKLLVSKDKSIAQIIVVLTHSSELQCESWLLRYWVRKVGVVAV